MFYRYIDRWDRLIFDHSVRNVLRTPPVVGDPASNLVILSQLQHKDVLMYLLATKSFCDYVMPKAFVIIDDGTLTASDKMLLAEHLPQPTFHRLDDFRSSHCPTGGTWERLLAIASYATDSYVMQLDSDTLTLLRPTEVIDNIRQGVSFTIGTWDHQEVEPMALCSQRVRDRDLITPQSHVQLAAEAAFLELEQCAKMAYVRGCSGFTGFAKGSTTRSWIETISMAMQDLLGDKWQEWGSEQVMSNIAIANSPKATVLPHPDYSSCLKMQANTRFVHFLGNCRFKNGLYSRLARARVNEILRTGT